MLSFTASHPSPHLKPAMHGGGFLLWVWLSLFYLSSLDSFLKWTDLTQNVPGDLCSCSQWEGKGRISFLIINIHVFSLDCACHYDSQISSEGNWHFIQISLFFLKAEWVTFCSWKRNENFPLLLCHLESLHSQWNTVFSFFSWLREFKWSAGKDTPKTSKREIVLDKM